MDWKFIKIQFWVKGYSVFPYQIYMIIQDGIKPNQKKLQGIVDTSKPEKPSKCKIY